MKLKLLMIFSIILITCGIVIMNQYQILRNKQEQNVLIIRNYQEQNVLIIFNQIQNAKFANYFDFNKYINISLINLLF